MTQDVLTEWVYLAGEDVVPSYPPRGQIESADS